MHNAYGNHEILIFLYKKFKVNNEEIVTGKWVKSIYSGLWNARFKNFGIWNVDGRVASTRFEGYSEGLSSHRSTQNGVNHAFLTGNKMML